MDNHIYTSNNRQFGVSQVTGGTSVIPNKSDYLVSEEKFKVTTGEEFNVDAQNSNEQFIKEASKVNYKNILRQIP